MPELITLPWRKLPLGLDESVWTSMTEKELGLLRRYADGSDVLEIGTAYGYGAAWMGQVARSVVTVDPFLGVDFSINDATELVRKLGLQSRVFAVQASSLDFLPWLFERGHRFNLIVVDGDHSYATVRRDLENAWALLHPAGILAVHDLDEASCPDVRRAIDAFYVITKPKLTAVCDTLWCASAVGHA